MLREDTLKPYDRNAKRTSSLIYRLMEILGKGMCCINYTTNIMLFTESHDIIS